MVFWWPEIANLITTLWKFKKCIELLIFVARCETSLKLIWSVKSERWTIIFAWHWLKNTAHGPPKTFTTFQLWAAGALAMVDFGSPSQQSSEGGKKSGHGVCRQM